MTTFLDLAARGKNAWWRYAASLLAAGAGTLVLFTVATFVFSALHWIPRDFAKELRQPHDVRMFFLGVAMVFGALLAASAGAFHFIQKKRIGDIAGAWHWSGFLWGAAIWSLVQLGITLVDFAIAPHGFRVTAGRGTLLLALTALAALPVQTFAEEFVFRGWLTQGLLLLFRRPLPAAVASGALFGALHIWNGVPEAVGAFVLGTVCALIAIRTAGLSLVFGLHLANNYFGAVIAVSAGDVFRGCPGLFEQDTPGLVWSDVGLMTLALVLVLRFGTRVPSSAGFANQRAR